MVFPNPRGQNIVYLLVQGEEVYHPSLGGINPDLLVLEVYVIQLDFDCFRNPQSEIGLQLEAQQVAFIVYGREELFQFFFREVPVESVAPDALMFLPEILYGFCLKIALLKAKRPSRDSNKVSRFSGRTGEQLG